MDSVEALLFSNNTDKIDGLLSRNDIDKPRLLLLAASYGLVYVVERLIQLELNVNETDEDEWTPLHYALFNNKDKMVDVLLKAGANIEAKNSDEKTPLHLAATNCYQEVIMVLLKHGANVNALDVNQKTPAKLTNDRDIKALLSSNQELPELKEPDEQ